MVHRMVSSDGRQTHRAVYINWSAKLSDPDANGKRDVAINVTLREPPEILTSMPETMSLDGVLGPKKLDIWTDPSPTRGTILSGALKRMKADIEGRIQRIVDEVAIITGVTCLLPGVDWKPEAEIGHGIPISSMALFAPGGVVRTRVFGHR